MSDRLLRESDVIEAVTQYISSDYSTEEMAREDAELLIGQIPSADRPQGEWTQNVFRSDIYRYECSNCKAHHRARYDFCPSCGTRMKGADDETAMS